MVSWHYTVDDHAIVQHLPDYETAYHAGDGKDGPGNTTSIGIEICVNAGGDFEAAKANAAALVRLLMEEHGISADRVVQHNHWNGKDCPKTIRATAGAWEAFLALCRGETANVSSWTPTWTRWLMSALSTSPTTGKPGTTQGYCGGPDRENGGLCKGRTIDMEHINGFKGGGRRRAGRSDGPVGLVWLAGACLAALYGARLRHRHRRRPSGPGSGRPGGKGRLWHKLGPWWPSWWPPFWTG